MPSASLGPKCSYRLVIGLQTVANPCQAAFGSSMEVERFLTRLSRSASRRDSRRAVRWMWMIPIVVAGCGKREHEAAPADPLLLYRKPERRQPSSLPVARVDND